MTRFGPPCLALSPPKADGRAGARQGPRRRRRPAAAREPRAARTRRELLEGCTFWFVKQWTEAGKHALIREARTRRELLEGDLERVRLLAGVHLPRTEFEFKLS